MPKIEKEKKDAILKAFRAIASENQAESAKASLEVSEAIALPLRKTLLSGDIVSNIFEAMDFTDNPRVEFPLDLLTPGDEAQHYAYVVPGEGRIPERRVESDYLMVPTYGIANAIDCRLRYIRDANWPVVQRMVEVLEGGFVKKMNDDGWQTIIAAAKDRNIIVNDPNAAQGQFTPRLITIMQTFMRRNGGGNSATMDRSRLTDLYVSPEAHQDIYAWGLDLIPDGVREKIYYASPESPDTVNIYNTRITALDEFGEGQIYQEYYTDVLNGTMAANDVEIVVGLDRQRQDSFVMPVRDNVKIFEDNMMHRRQLFGLYGMAEIGFAVLDNRRTLLGSL